MSQGTDFDGTKLEASNLTLDKIQEAMDLQNGNINQEETVEELKQTLTEAEKAFIFLAKSNSEFRNIVTNLRKKGSAGRILESILFDPFVEVNLLGEEETELFDFCKTILYYRDVAMRDVIEKNPDKFKKENVNESNTTNEK